MLSERIRNAPLLTFDDALDTFEAATSSLPQHFSVSQLFKAYEWEIASALAVSAGELAVSAGEPAVSASELSTAKNPPPWVKS